MVAFIVLCVGVMCVGVLCVVCRCCVCRCYGSICAIIVQMLSLQSVSNIWRGSL